MLQNRDLTLFFFSLNVDLPLKVILFRSNLLSSYSPLFIPTNGYGRLLGKLSICSTGALLAWGAKKSNQIKP